jgi:hypothetical protein
MLTRRFALFALAPMLLCAPALAEEIAETEDAPQEPQWRER